MRILFLSVLLVAIGVSSCTPNQSIALDKTNDPNAAANKTPELPPAPPVKITVAELMERVANAAPDAFLLPCDLRAYSESGREDLRQLRNDWLKTADDNRYLVSPSKNCVCPGLCVIAVEDTQRPAPKNTSLLVINEFGRRKIKWLAKGLDLTNTRLAWASSEPEITFYNPDGTRKYVCFFRINSKTQNIYSDCGDGQKNFTPLESQ
ncbi:MAG: hypothetical protein ABI878_09265 [Acidobacteriota bacterium]